MKHHFISLLICMPLPWMPMSSAMASTTTTTITMDEVPYQQADGLTVKGVRFGYAIEGQPSDAAVIHSFGAGDLNHVSGASLEGSTDGELSLSFEKPTAQFSFGIALMSEEALSQAASISVYTSASELLEQFWLDTEPLVVFSEARFSYLGQQASVVKIHFTDPTRRFALDNLAFESTPSIPEPGAFSLLWAGGLVLGWAANRSSKAR